MKFLSALPVRSWVDVAVLTVLSVIGILGFAPSFTDSRYLVAGIGGLLVGTLAGVLAAVFRLGPLLTLLGGVVLYFLFGSALAMPEQAIAAVFPSLDSLDGLAVGAVFGWADMVTLTTPVAAPDYIGVLPYVAAFVVGMVSATLAGRWFARTPRTAVASFLALVAPLVVYIVSVLTGTETPYLAGIRGIAFAMIALTWMAWRVGAGDGASVSARAVVLRRRISGIAIIAVVAIGGGVVLGGAASPSAGSRFVLRDHIEPPFDPTLFPSPLSGFRAYLKTETEGETMLTATGLHEGDHIRLATMDQYDGRLWSVSGPQVATDGSGTFKLVSSRLPAVPAFTPDGTRTVTITIEGYHDVWVPTTGYATEIDFDAPDAPSSTALRYNDATGIAVDIDRLTTGMTYTFDAVSQKQDAPRLAKAPVAIVSLPQPQNVPDFLVAKANDWTADAGTPYEKLTAIESHFENDDFYFSHGQGDEHASSAGHGADRMNRLFSGKEAAVGDQEQYASAFALMARVLGYPSRVVVGFSPEVAADGTAVITGENIDAWVEVKFDRIGWVSFFPRATKTVVPEITVPKPKSKPQPLVRQPPRDTSGHDDASSAALIDDREENRFVIPKWVWTLAAALGIPLALYFIPLFVVSRVKARRRHRRRTSGPVDRRAAGAWDELVDRYSELGYQAPQDATRVQLALLFEQQFRTELQARSREREDAAMRMENKQVRAAAAAEAKRLRAASGNASTTIVPTRDQIAGLLSSTVLRARDASTWRPGVAAADDALPAIPGLRDFAVAADAAVFSGRELDDADVTTLWAESADAAQAARSSVSWFRRRLSGFRVRARLDVRAFAARLNGMVPRRGTRKVATT